jgi:hypothetical protein
MNRQALEALVGVLETDSGARQELELAARNGESQLVAAFQAIGGRTGLTINGADVSALFDAARAIDSNGAAGELDHGELDRVTGGTMGEDAQLANVDLQNMLQKQQQTLMMMSNIGKTLSDTNMAAIRKIGG